ncbi:MAG: efflux RND transporter periplasmic adaptor subunit, partial [Planctomycetota bacterium]|nr:efflux RND transporter periplasmic adaptor subunit [Planctomycetota bacterium]
MKERITRTIKHPRGATRIGVLLLLVAIVISLVVGYMARGVFVGPDSGKAGASAQQVARKKDKAPQLWTCSMHPQIKLLKPGLCPLCNMKLIPLETQDEDAGSLRELTVSENARKLMEIQTVPVERKFVEAEVRMVGKIDYDETRLKYITAWIPGRLDRLFVDYTGVSVKKGYHMVYLYSPELLSAQEELLQALETIKELEKSDIGIIRETSEATVVAAREKLRLWGLKPEQIAEIEKRGTTSDHMTIYAPSGGIVIHKNAQEGMYVNTGTKIYTIADLSQVWVKLDAYESDLMWLRYGQKVQFTTEAYPGKRFVGTIAFIDPILTQTTRTVKVRVNATNPRMRLKPGMFVRAVARAKLAAGGKVVDAALAGKWICPMHPEIVKKNAGKCDICEMPLMRTESMGYLGLDATKADKPLIIPASAALVTGTRAIVYVEVPGRKKPTFEGREIVLGPRAGDYYLVRHGLAEGQRVVTKGNFKLDAELQIRAKPSMMTPEGGDGGGGHQHGGPVAGKKDIDSDKMAMKLPPMVQAQLHAVLAVGQEIDSAIVRGDL